VKFSGHPSKTEVAELRRTGVTRSDLFKSTDEIEGLQGKRKLRGAAGERVYAALKATVLAAGRFSVFEATASTRAAHMFARLCEDSDLEIDIDMGLPWTGVRRRACPACTRVALGGHEHSCGRP
jgi:hypothetical protein